MKERAEAAEAELEAVRDDNHSMMLEIHNLRIERDALADELAKLWEREPVGQVQGSSPDNKWPVMRTLGEFPPIGTYLYAAPLPAVAAGLPAIGPYRDFIPAPAVPEEWREVMAELAADLQAACDAEHPHRDQYPSVMRKYQNDMRIVGRARALLQSAPVSAEDCRTCANRGRVNGLSQESYCDSCVYQGRDWRKNHFVDASKMVDAKGFRASTKDSGCVK